MDAKKTGKIIAQLRKQQGYTQKTLSEALSVTDKAVSKWERGLGCPDISVLPKLSVLLNTDIESILSGESVHKGHHVKGILFLDGKGDSYSGTIVYDKPLINYLLSFFLLVGIKDILIVASASDREFIQNDLADGKKLGLAITYGGSYSGENAEAALEIVQNYIDNDSVLFIFGKMMPYGLDITRQLQNIILQDSGGVSLSLYNGTSVPMFFCCNDLCQRILSELDNVKKICDLSAAACNYSGVVTRQLGRGIIGLPLNTYDEVENAAQFVRLIQTTQGQYISCIEEIAWRRGLINDEQLDAMLCGVTDKRCREYLSSLTKNHFN